VVGGWGGGDSHGNLNELCTDKKIQVIRQVHPVVKIISTHTNKSKLQSKYIGQSHPMDNSIKYNVYFWAVESLLHFYSLPVT
jgi:hypothetical protein